VPAAHSSLPDLVIQRPERYRRTIDRANRSSILIFTAADDSDFNRGSRRAYLSVEKRIRPSPGGCPGANCRAVYAARVEPGGNAIAR
jgi:hypothetical protein